MNPALKSGAPRARKRSPIPKGKWKPIDARKFGYDVSVVEVKWLAIFRREMKLGNPRFSWREFSQWIELYSEKIFLQRLSVHFGKTQFKNSVQKTQFK